MYRILIPSFLTLKMLINIGWNKKPYGPWWLKKTFLVNAKFMRSKDNKSILAD